MQICPIGEYASSIEWKTLRTEAVSVPYSAPATPTASVAETARMQVNQLSVLPLVAGSLDPVFHSLKVGQVTIAVTPVLGTSSWGFG